MTNTKADILFKKDQIDTIENNKDIKMLKDELQIRQINTEEEIIVFRGSQVVEKITLLKEIRKNQIREQKVQKKLEKDKQQV